MMTEEPPPKTPRLASTSEWAVIEDASLEENALTKRLAESIDSLKISFDASDSNKLSNENFDAKISALSQEIL